MPLKRTPVPKSADEEQTTTVKLEDIPATMQDFETSLTNDSLAPFTVSALGTAFETVVTAIKDELIPSYELRKILDVLPAQESVQGFDANFDMGKEITNQLQALQAVRNKIFSSDGRIKEGQTVKDAKDFMASSASLLQLLQKSKSELINLERLQAIEEAVIDALKELGDDATELFLKKLEERLERID